MSTPSKGTALITGASSGIGALYADRLARRGYDLVLVARNQARLSATAKRVGEATGRKVDTVTADLNNPSDLRRVEALLRSDPGIVMLVNNAGVGATAPLLDADVDAMEDMIALNVTALTRLTYAAVPAFMARGSGTVINIASVVAIAPEILNGVYGATKAFVLALSQSLHKELGDRGLRVQAVLPGATATNFWNAAGSSVESLPGEIVMRTEDLVDAAFVGFDRGELVTMPPLENLADWNAYEAARQAMIPNLSRDVPATRYRMASAA